MHTSDWTQRATTGFLAAAIVVMNSATASAGQTNFLLGQWNLTGQHADPDYPDTTCDRTALLFKSDRFGVFMNGKWLAYPVSRYEQNGNRIFARSIPSDEAFTVIDSNTIQRVEDRVQCIYTRAH